MASHPEIWSQVTAEVTDKDKAVTGKDKEVTVPALNSLTFLHCCLLETLRLYPPASLHVREALSDDTLPSGLHVRRGQLTPCFPTARAIGVYKLAVEPYRPAVIRAVQICYGMCYSII
eukprot:3002379-Rhodomonas_salina.1